MDIYSKVGWGITDVSKITIQWKAVPMPDQGNAVDCGIWVCIYLYCFYRSWIIDERHTQKVRWGPTQLQTEIIAVIGDANWSYASTFSPMDIQQTATKFRKFMLRCFLGTKKVYVPQPAESASSGDGL